MTERIIFESRLDIPTVISDLVVDDSCTQLRLNRYKIYPCGIADATLVSEVRLLDERYWNDKLMLPRNRYMIAAQAGVGTKSRRLEINDRAEIAVIDNFC